MATPEQLASIRAVQPNADAVARLVPVGMVPTPARAPRREAAKQPAAAPVKKRNKRNGRATTIYWPEDLHAWLLGRAARDTGGNLTLLLVRMAEAARDEALGV